MKCQFCENEGRYACIDGALTCALCAMVKYPGQNVRISDTSLVAQLNVYNKALVQAEREERKDLAEDIRYWFENKRS